MSIARQLESNALNELRDISQYTSYIDRRIYKLNQLYRSLEINKNKQQPDKRQKSQRNTTNIRFNQTAKEADNFGNNREVSNASQAFSNTQYKSEKRRNFLQTISHARAKQEAKNELFYRTCSPSEGLSTFYKTRKRANSKTDQNQERLNIYRQAKAQMLGTFFIGQTSPVKTAKRSSPLENVRHSECNYYEMKGRKGRVWHGRPPVKIIERYSQAN